MPDVVRSCIIESFAPSTSCCEERGPPANGYAKPVPHYKGMFENFPPRERTFMGSLLRSGLMGVTLWVFWRTQVRLFTHL